MDYPPPSEWRWPNFSPDEMRCKHTGKLSMDPEFMDILQRIRLVYGKPMRVSSGYRAPEHPVEQDKPEPGEHTYGRCVDIAVQGSEAVLLLGIALQLGITRVGVQQKGSRRFLHLGIGAADLPNPAMWSY